MDRARIARGRGSGWTATPDQPSATENRGNVTDGKVAHWQVSLKIGFTLE